MQAADFTSDAPGKLVSIPEGVAAFVPDPLPPRFTLDTPTANLLAETRGAVGELAGVGRLLPNPHLLINPFLRREAISSSRIEGTYATAEELSLFEAEDSKPPSKPDIREVANYVRAMKYGLGRLADLPICSRFIRELHERLMEGVRGQEEHPGEFRTVQNAIGKRGDPIEKARFVPPPPAEMQRGMNKLEKYIAEGNNLHIIIRTAMIHYQFETIHPFRDGNGRLGRLLASLLFCEHKLLPEPLLYLSSFFDRNNDEYRDRLLAVSQRGEWLEWVSFFLRAVQEQSRDAIARAGRLLALWERWRRETQSARSSALLPRLVDALFSTPALTIPKAAKIMGVTYAAAQRNVLKLVEAGILRPASDATYNKVYVADDVIKIVAMESA